MTVAKLLFKQLFSKFVVAIVAFRFLNKHFSTGVKPSSKEIKWWSVDLIALCKFHLVSIVTASSYKLQHFKGLKILIG